MHAHLDPRSIRLDELEWVCAVWGGKSHIATGFLSQVKDTASCHQELDLLESISACVNGCWVISCDLGDATVLARRRLYIRYSRDKDEVGGMHPQFRGRCGDDLDMHEEPLQHSLRP